MVQSVFNSDGTFQQTFLVPTSSATANEVIQKGIWQATSTVLTLTPQESSCPSPVAVSNSTYAFVTSGNTEVLVVTDSNGNSTGSTKESNPSTLGAGLTLVVGCGSPFTASPVAPVTN
jgi:hypothetical protein